MIEGVVTLIGLCITVCPAIIYFKYLLTHVSKKTRFDYHLELVKDKKGKMGVYLAYVERVLFGFSFCSLGILMSEFFNNDKVFIIFVISLILYIVVKYFDEKNEK